MMLCAFQHADGEKPHDIPIHIIVDTYACTYWLIYFNVRKRSNIQVKMRPDIQNCIWYRHFKLYFDEMYLLFHIIYIMDAGISAGKIEPF